MINTQPMICNICGGKVIYTSNAAVYHGRQYGSGYCYLCLDCEAYVGTHAPNPKKALELLADLCGKVKSCATTTLTPCGQVRKMPVIFGAVHTAGLQVKWVYRLRTVTLDILIFISYERRIGSSNRLVNETRSDSCEAACPLG